MPRQSDCEGKARPREAPCAAAKLTDLATLFTGDVELLTTPVATRCVHPVCYGILRLVCHQRAMDGLSVARRAVEPHCTRRQSKQAKSREVENACAGDTFVPAHMSRGALPLMFQRAEAPHEGSTWLGTAVANPAWDAQ